MIDYVLAKKLKDVGFPQTFSGESFKQGDTHPTPNTYIPALSELIEACGRTHPKYPEYEFVLLISEGEWCAGFMDDEMHTALPIGKGTTPEEAVANLFLAIHTSEGG